MTAVPGQSRQRTLLDLLVALQAAGPERIPEQVLVAIALQAINSGAVVLAGNYAGTELPVR